MTGKGGVGKSTVAAALGVAAAREGKRAIVCEVAQQERMSRFFERQGVGYHETEIAPNLFAFSIDPQRALEEYLLLQIKVKPVYDLMFKNRVFTYFAAATPGLRELVTIGKVWELAQLDRRVKKGAKYDVVIVDAPATGHGLGILRTPKTFSDIARVGPDQAPGGHDLRVHHRPEADLDLRRRLAGGDAGQRDARPAAKPEARARPEARPGLHERHLPGAVQRRRGGDPARALERDGAGERRRRRGRAAGGAARGDLRAPARHAPTASSSSGSRKGLRKDVVELPFLFRPQLDMSAVEELAGPIEEGSEP